MTAQIDRLKLDVAVGLSGSEVRDWIKDHKEPLWQRIRAATPATISDDEVSRHLDSVLEQCCGTSGAEFVPRNYTGETPFDQWLMMVVLRRLRSAHEDFRRPSGTELDDSARVEALKQGDEEACREFLLEARSWLDSYLLPKAGDSRQRELAHGVIDDLLSDLFGRNLLQRFSGTGSLRGWICRAGLNRFRDSLRSGRYRYETQFPSSANGESLEDRTFAAAPSSDVDPVVLETLNEGLKVAFGTLSHRELFLVRLVHLHGVERQILARLLDVHPATVGREIGQVVGKVSRQLSRFLKDIDPDGDLDLSEYVAFADHFRRALHGGTGEVGPQMNNSQPSE